MRRFLRTIGIGVAIVIVLLGGAEWIAESIPNSYVYKREYMETHGSEIKTLILGSSNAYDGLNPSELPAAFNLTNSSQTLEDDYRLLAKYIDGMDSLQTVILGLGYHSLGETQETHRRTYYTIYMDLYPRWPISRNSLEIMDLRLLTKKIIKYAVSRDVTRCDSLGQRVGHTREAAENGDEWWNKDVESLVDNDRWESNKNIQNTAYADINKEKEENKNTHSTPAMSDGPRGLERNHPQALTSELAAPVDANTPNLLPDEQHVECLQKCVVPPYKKNQKNNYSQLSALESSLQTNITYLYEIGRLCKAKGVQLVVVQMPVMKEYKEALPKEQVALQDSVLRAMESMAVCIDASEWEIPEDGWYNATHLTREASVEFTKRIKENIASL